MTFQPLKKYTPFDRALIGAFAASAAANVNGEHLLAEKAWRLVEREAVVRYPEILAMARRCQEEERNLAEDLERLRMMSAEEETANAV